MSCSRCPQVGVGGGGTHGRDGRTDEDCEDCEEERPSESAAKRMAAESIWSGFEFTTHAEFRDRVKHPYIPRSLVLDGYVPQTLRWEQILGGFGIACAVVAGKITSTNAHAMHQTATSERFSLQKQRRWMWRKNSMSSGNAKHPNDELVVSRDWALMIRGNAHARIRTLRQHSRLHHSLAPLSPPVLVRSMAIRVVRRVWLDPSRDRGHICGVDGILQGHHGEFPR